MTAERKRYTPNDVGPSPLEWNAPRLSEVSTLITNGFVGTATPYYSDRTGVPYLYGTNVRANKLETDKVRYITHEFHAAQSKTALKSGDLLTVQSGHIGETAVVPEHLEGSNCHALIVTRLKQNKAYPKYLSYYVNSEIGRARMRGLEVGSTILHINTKDLKKFRVLLPSLSEQKKIAQILSTWDKAIATTEQLLANSQQQKKALMQHLLTGNKRLRGFSGDFKRHHFDELLDIDSKSLNSRTPENLEFNYISLSDVEPATVSSNLKRYQYKDAPSRARRVVKENDILLSTVRPNLKGFAKVEAQHDEYVASTGFAVLTPRDGTCGDYIFHYLFNAHISGQINALVVGTNYPAINSSDVAGLCVYCPPYQEQVLIADILTKCDKTINTLKSKINALKQEKKALMQQLLTGKRRVKVDEEAAA